MAKKVIEGWTYKEWPAEFSMRKGWPSCVDIPGIYSKITKEDIEDIESAGKVKVRITIEEI